MKLSRHERIHGERGANKSTRITRMKTRIAKRKAKEPK